MGSAIWRMAPVKYTAKFLKTENRWFEFYLKKSLKGCCCELVIFSGFWEYFCKVWKTKNTKTYFYKKSIVKFSSPNCSTLMWSFASNIDHAPFFWSGNKGTKPLSDVSDAIAIWDCHQNRDFSFPLTYLASRDKWRFTSKFCLIESSKICCPWRNLSWGGTGSTII